ncbi:caspase family protein [Treponema sp. R8-4-B8]
MRRIFLAYWAVFFAILSYTGLYAQDRGLLVVAAENLGTSAAIGKQYALFIAIDAYRSWPALKKPVADAREIRDILKQQYYIDEVIELYNQQATRANITKTFVDLQTKLDIHDSLFIYYAGHGHLDEGSGIGFWIPVDGGTDVYSMENWLPNSQIRGYISRFKTIHVFMVSDSCFSGDILNTSRSSLPQIDNAYYRKAYALTSRQVLTSGSSETVPDQSEFSEAIKNCLRKNTAPLLDPFGIYNDVRLSVRSTTPLYGTLNAANHQEGATFIFFRRQTA